MFNKMLNLGIISLNYYELTFTDAVSRMHAPIDLCSKINNEGFLSKIYFFSFKDLLKDMRHFRVLFN